MKVGLTPVCRISYHQLTPNWWLLCAFVLLKIILPGITLAQSKIWDKTIGTNTYEYLSSLQQTSDGGYILGGSSGSGIDGDKSEANRGEFDDYWIVKLKADGTKEWDKTIGGSSSDKLNSLQQTRDGGYILGGASRSDISGEKSENSKGSYDFWIVKLRADGTKEWDKTIGGRSSDDLNSLQQTSDGGYILGGTSGSDISGDKSEDRIGGCDEGGCYYDYWVVKLDANGTKVWDQTIGGNENDILQTVRQTSDGGFILGGNSTSGISGDKSEAHKGGVDEDGDLALDYWVVKLDAKGTIVWDQTIGGNGNDRLQSFQQTSDGGYIVGGSSNSGINGDKTQASKDGDYWVVKLKADGSKMWDKTLGGDSGDGLQSIQQTNDGGYLLGGNSISDISGDKSENSKGGADYWLVKLNAAGTKVWDRTIGGNSYDFLEYAQQSSDGGYILGGSSYSNKSGDKTENSRGSRDLADFWVVKLDKNGTILNQSITFEPIPDKTYGNAPFILSAKSSSGLPVTFSVVSGPAFVKGKNLTLTGSDSVTVKASQAGNVTYRPEEVTQTFFVRLSDITKPWDKTIGGDDHDYLQAIISTSDGGYLMGGSSLSGASGDKSQNNKGGRDYWLVKMDSTGKKIWDKTFGGSGQDNLTSLLATPDGNFLLGGSSESGKSTDKSQASKGSADYWIIKIDGEGNLLWDQTYGGTKSDNLSALLATPDGGYLLGGSSESGHNGDKSQGSKGSVDYWIIKIDATGKILWDQAYGGTKSDYLAALVATPDGGYLLGGSSESGISGDKSQTTRALTDYWVVRIQENGTKIWDKTLGGNKESYTSDDCNPNDTLDCQIYFGHSILSSLVVTPDGGFLLGGSSNAEKGVEKSEENLNTDKKGLDVNIQQFWVVKLDGLGNKAWDKTYGGVRNEYSLTGDINPHFTGDSRLRSIIAIPGGDYLLAGTSNSDKGGDKSEKSRSEINYGSVGYDYWVVKIEENGQKLWDKTFGGPNYEFLTGAVSRGERSYILAGTSYSGLGEDKSEENKGGEYNEKADYWLVKLEESSSPFTDQWNMRYGGAGTDNFTDAIKAADGGYLAAGYSNSGIKGDKSQSSQGKNDYWIVKSDKNGKKLWDKRYGGSSDDYLNRVIQTQDGGYLLGGSSISGIGGDKTQASQGDRDYWVIKLDAKGNKQWDKTFGGSGFDELKKVVQLTTGEYVLGGYSNSPASGDKTKGSQGENDYWLVKISATGTKLWDKRYGGSMEEILGSFTETGEGGFILGGTSWSGLSGDKSQASQGASDYWVVKTDKDGNLLWEKTLGGTGEDEAYSIGRSQGDNFFISGTSTSGTGGDKSQASQGGKDYWMLQLDGSGRKLWEKSFGGSQDDVLRASTYTDEGTYVLAGHSFSEESGDKAQSSRGSSDYWAVQVDKDGNKLANFRFGGSGQEELRTVFQTHDGGLLLGGRSGSNVSGDKTQPSQGGTDYWLVKVASENAPIVAVRETTMDVEQEVKPGSISLQVFPNPFSIRANISFTLPETQMTTVKVYDTQGREVTTLFQGEAKAKQEYQVEWQANSRKGGLYILQLQTPTKRIQQKLISLN